MLIVNKHLPVSVFLYKSLAVDIEDATLCDSKKAKQLKEDMEETCFPRFYPSIFTWIPFQPLLWEHFFLFFSYFTSLETRKTFNLQVNLQVVHIILPYMHMI